MARRVVHLDGISDNVTAGYPATAWYVLPPVPWTGTTVADREHIVAAGAKRLAQLVGRRVHWRVTPRPVSIRSWDVTETRNVAARSPLGADWLEHHRQIAQYVDDRSYTKKIVFFGVDLQRPASWLTKVGVRKTDPDIEVRDITRIVSGPGLWGRPATTKETAWLVWRSVRLGHRPLVIPDVGGDWTADDMPELTAGVDEHMDPFGGWVQITAPPGKRISANREGPYTAIVTVGRMVKPEVDAYWLHDPWLARCDTLDFPVEYAVTADILEPKAVLSRTDYALRKVRSQRADAVKYHREIHHSLETAAPAAKDIQRDVEAGMTDLSTRADVWVRMAVSADDPDEALARAQEIVDRHSPDIGIVGYTSTAYLEFTPGERLHGGGSHRQQLGVTTVAVGMPATAARIGHDSGMYFGYTSARAGDRGPVFWDIHKSMRDNGQGTTVISGVTGAGKSMAGAVITVESVRSGAVWFVLDPSGPLSRLAYLDDLRPYAAHWDLLANPRPGVLNPYAIVKDPNRANYATDGEYTYELGQAENLRRQLCRDTFRMYLPVSQQEQWMTEVALTHATEAVAATRNTSPMEVIAALQDVCSDDAELTRFSRYCAQFLTSVAKEPTGRLVFPSDSELDYRHGDDTRLTVVTARGLDLPHSTDPKRWSAAQARAVPLWALTAWKIEREIFAANRNIPKGVYIDEGKRITNNPVGQDFGDHLGHDARKHYCRFLLNVHAVAEAQLVLGLDNLVDSWLTGRTVSRPAQRDALAAMSCPVDVGYEEVLGELDDGEFLVKLSGQTPERVQMDTKGAYPDVFAIQNTTPDEQRLKAS